MIAIVFVSCDQDQNVVQNANPEIFPKGEIINMSSFVGTAWLTRLVSADSMNFNSVGSVTFETGARTDWHYHPAGQIILVLGGVGYYQEKDSKKRILRKGDAIKCPPDVPHWHGASADEEFVQIAITGRKNGPTVWLDRVSDEEYGSEDIE